MGGDDQILRVPQGVILRQRLRNEYVQCGTGQLVLIEGVHQRLLIHGAAAAHIDDIGGFREKGDAVAVQNMLCFRRTG